MQLLREKCAMLDSEDTKDQISLSYDAFAAEKNFFYNYNEFRGFTKASKGTLGDWKKVVAINPITGLQGVSLLVYKGMLLVRHKD